MWKFEILDNTEINDIFAFVTNYLLDQYSRLDPLITALEQDPDSLTEIEFNDATDRSDRAFLRADKLTTEIYNRAEILDEISFIVRNDADKDIIDLALSEEGVRFTLFIM
jgi:hypothetical protein